MKRCHAFFPPVLLAIISVSIPAWADEDPLSLFQRDSLGNRQFDGMPLDEWSREQVHEHYGPRLAFFRTCPSSIDWLVDTERKWSTSIHPPILGFDQDDRFCLASLEFVQPRPLSTLLDQLRVDPARLKSDKAPPTRLYSDADGYAFELAGDAVRRVEVLGRTKPGLAPLNPRDPPPTVPTAFVHCPVAWSVHRPVASNADQGETRVLANFESLNQGLGPMRARAEFHLRNAGEDYLPTMATPANERESSVKVRFVQDLGSTTSAFFIGQVSQPIPIPSMSRSLPTIARVTISAGAHSSWSEVEISNIWERGATPVERAVRLWKVSVVRDAMDPNSSTETPWPTLGLKVFADTSAEGLGGTEVKIDLEFLDAKSGQAVRMRPPPTIERADGTRTPEFLATRQMVPATPRHAALPRSEIWIPYRSFDLEPGTETTCRLITRASAAGLSSTRCEDVIVKIPEPPGARATVMTFLGVTPGKTSMEELSKLTKWGEPTRPATTEGMATFLSYRVLKYNATLSARDGKVWAIDLELPVETKPERIAEGLKLGELMNVQALPLGAEFGPKLADDTRMYVSNVGAAIVFVDPAGDARRIRFYAP